MTEKILEEIATKAARNDRYSGCSQSVLLAIQEGFNIGNLESFKAATVLSGGVARNGETCGALIGGLMALGLVIGRERMEDTNVYVNAVNVANEIMSKFKTELSEAFNFKQRLKSTLCCEIQEKIFGRSFKITDPAERQAFLEAGGHSDEGCFKVCGVAARVAAEKILEIMKHETKNNG